MSERGVIYLCWGQKAIQQAEVSMASLWQYAPDMPVLVVGDAESATHFTDREHVQTALVDVDPFELSRRAEFQFLAGRVKALLAGLSPFERSLYVDADSAFGTAPDLGFALLDKWDVVLAETETRTLGNSVADQRESKWTAEWLGTPHLLYHNSGMIFWRKNAATAQLFDLWGEEWLRFQSWDEQVALLRAFLRSEVVYLTVPHTWNCREGAKATLLHHRFGTKVARQSVPTRSEHPPSYRRAALTPVPLVRVEVSPGRFVRCKPGEEEMIKNRFAARRRA